MATRITRRNAGLGLAAGVLIGVLAACGGGGGNGDGNGATTPSPPTRGGKQATQVDVNMTDFKLALSEKTFKAGAYTFVAKNSGHHDHALEIEGNGDESRTRTLDPGQSAKLDVTLKDGTYQVYCPVDGHKDLGMKTEITVGGATMNQNPSKGDGH
ncbi:copper-binding protein [Streptomyces sp. XD-27]|uniref:copper-binding protein n=1 Tax=Streptomyces sp. XD-27 TaxID=3062779 RepID=UPI0026F47B49|nr:copper-binding protein [Streptomyces sp. XD-27]WKX69316.1 copper-binding protein [Streptomyces sp. XD-27]